MNNFGGHLMMFKDQNDSEAAIDEDVLVEVIDFQKDGMVELAFDIGIGTGRAYLQFRLQDVMYGIARSHGTEIAQ